MNAPAKTATRPRLIVILAVLVIAVVIAVYAVLSYQSKGQQLHLEATSSLNINLGSPELHLRTQNLSQLPKDVVSMPILAGLIDEQFVFYYEENEARLSLEGSLKRLAFEHDLQLQDRFLSLLLDAPAEVALWRSGKGRPEYFVAKLERGLLGKLAETIAKIALNDKQLRKSAEITVGKASVPLYSLSYAGRRTLLFAGQGDHWVVISDPGIIFDNEGKITEDAKAILGELLKNENPWQEGLPTREEAKHSLVIGQNAVTMGYGHFLAGLNGVRIDFQDNAWKMSLRLMPESGVSYDASHIWRGVPLNAALCVALPVSWTSGVAPVEALTGNAEAAKTVLDSLDPVAAACWYPESRLAAPLFIARAKQTLPPQTGEWLASLAQKAWLQGSSPQREEKGSTEIFSLNVPSQHGIASAKGRSFDVALARSGEWLYFSPDRRLVDAALQVADKQAPALGDETGLTRAAWVAFDPAGVARLVRAETQIVISPNSEPVLHEVAKNRLWPRLESWGKQHKAVVLIPGKTDRDGFMALNSQPLGKR